MFHFSLVEIWSFIFKGHNKEDGKRETNYQSSCCVSSHLTWGSEPDVRHQVSERWWARNTDPKTDTLIWIDNSDLSRVYLTSKPVAAGKGCWSAESSMNVSIWVYTVRKNYKVKQRGVVAVIFSPSEHPSINWKWKNGELLDFHFVWSTQQKHVNIKSYSSLFLWVSFVETHIAGKNIAIGNIVL